MMTEPWKIPRRNPKPYRWHGIYRSTVLSTQSVVLAHSRSGMISRAALPRSRATKSRRATHIHRPLSTSKPDARMSSVCLLYVCCMSAVCLLCLPACLFCICGPLDVHCMFWQPAKNPSNKADKDKGLVRIRSEPYVLIFSLSISLCGCFLLFSFSAYFTCSDHPRLLIGGIILLRPSTPTPF